MFSYEERIKAVKLLIQYDMSYADAIRELGYPSKMGLRKWYDEYREYGDLHDKFDKKSKYSEEAPMQKRHCRSDGAVVRYTREQKEQAVISLCSRSKSAKAVTAEHGTTRENLYNWKRQLLEEERVHSMSNEKSNKTINAHSIEVEVSELRSEKDNLSSQVAGLQKEVRRLKIERDIYEKAAEIIKKDQGINLQTLTNREKAIIINALRESYLLKELLEIMCMAKSSYCYQILLINTDKYADLKAKVKNAFEE